MIHTIRTGLHTAYVHPMSGEGLLVLPHPSENVWLATEGVHASDWNEMVRRLDDLGYDIGEDQDGSILYERVTTPDGRAVVGLFGRDPIVSDPSLAEAAEASAALLRLVEA